MEMNFHYAACTYLNEYMETDKPCIESLQSTEIAEEKACEALAQMAWIYEISQRRSVRGAGILCRAYSPLSALSQHT